jgi:hypothetical protein
VTKKPKLTDLAPTLDTSYLSMQADLFRSGSVGEIGAHAFTVWSCIKSFADYSTGECWPSIRRLADNLRMSTETVQRALTTLEDAHMLRVTRGRPNRYVARDRMDLRMGDLLLCTVIVDYAPARLRGLLDGVKDALEGRSTEADAADALALVEILPGPGLSGGITGSVPIAGIGPPTITSGIAVADRIKALRAAVDKSQ